ncbi:hypothetical protein V8E55_008905 [Tylopilus felleus]
MRQVQPCVIGCRWQGCQTQVIRKDIVRHIRERDLNHIRDKRANTSSQKRNESLSENNSSALKITRHKFSVLLVRTKNELTTYGRVPIAIHYPPPLLDFCFAENLTQGALPILALLLGIC